MNQSFNVISIHVLCVRIRNDQLSGFQEQFSGFPNSDFSISAWHDPDKSRISKSSLHNLEMMNCIEFCSVCAHHLETRCTRRHCIACAKWSSCGTCTTRTSSSSYVRPLRGPDFGDVITYNAPLLLIIMRPYIMRPYMIHHNIWCALIWCACL